MPAAESYSSYQLHNPTAIFRPIPVRSIGFTPPPLAFVCCYFVFPRLVSLFLFRYAGRAVNAILRR